MSAMFFPASMAAAQQHAALGSMMDLGHLSPHGSPMRKQGLMRQESFHSASVSPRRSPVAPHLRSRGSFVAGAPPGGSFVAGAPESDRLTAAQPSLDEEPRRILLTSNGLSNPSIARDLVALLRSRKPEGNPKVMYVPDAGVGNGGNVNGMFQHARTMLSKVGVSQVICTELRTTTPASLAAQLDGVDMIYCDMGNTFYLRHQMRTSGFDRLVPQLVKEFGVVWFGSSSGSICAGRTISTALWKGWDDPGQGKEWDQTRTDYAGLDLVSGKSFFPHFEAGQFGRLVETRRRDLDHELVVIGEETAYIEGMQDPSSPGHAGQSITDRRPSPQLPLQLPAQAVQHQPMSMYGGGSPMSPYGGSSPMSPYGNGSPMSSVASRGGASPQYGRQIQMTPPVSPQRQHLAMRPVMLAY